MRINTVPVEAYRQASEPTSRKTQTSKEQADAGKAIKNQKITLPGLNDAEAGSIKASAAPSILNGVLSTEEKNMLVKHFARLGDSHESSQIYGTNARVHSGTMTGVKLDVKG